MAGADSPSLLAVHPSLPVVYAAGEQSPDRTGVPPVRRIRPRAGRPGVAGGGSGVPRRRRSAGALLTVACWGDGQVLLFELDHDGGLAARFAAAASAAPGRPRRAHASLMLADGRVMTTDLWHDLLRVWNYRPGHGLTLDHELTLPHGSGPRHLVQHSSGCVFVVTEYSIEVAVVQRSGEAGTYRLAGVGPATTAGALAGDSAAEIALSADGRYAYVGVRGSNRIGVLAVEADGTSLRPLADVPSGGDWPRHHLVRNGSLHVVHERSHDVVTFRLDPASGLPGKPTGRVAVASPTALIPARI
ncbi:6-phosphogluconolactonase [Arthrobacter sp. UYCu712]